MLFMVRASVMSKLCLCMCAHMCVCVCVYVCVCVTMDRLKSLLPPGWSDRRWVGSTADAQRCATSTSLSAPPPSPRKLSWISSMSSTLIPNWRSVWVLWVWGFVVCVCVCVFVFVYVCLCMCVCVCVCVCVCIRVSVCVCVLNMCI